MFGWSIYQFVANFILYFLRLEKFQNHLYNKIKIDIHFPCFDNNRATDKNWPVSHCQYFFNLNSVLMAWISTPAPSTFLINLGLRIDRSFEFLLIWKFGIGSWEFIHDGPKTVSGLGLIWWGPDYHPTKISVMRECEISTPILGGSEIVGKVCLM